MRESAGNVSNEVDIDELADLMMLNPEANPQDIIAFLKEEAAERIARGQKWAEIIPHEFLELQGSQKHQQE